MKIAIEHLMFLPPGLRVRTASPSEAAIATMAASMREVGQLQPIVVSPPRGPGDVYVIAGEKRSRAAMLLGWSDIEAVEAPKDDDAWIVAAQTAENMMREGMGPVEQWRAIVHMRELGYTLPAAAATLGISERQARKLEKLGALHPTILDAIARGDMPEERSLAAIAGATQEEQAKALKHCLVKAGPNKGCITWWELSRALSKVKIPLSRAIFDTTKTKLVFEEDLFAPANEPEFYTSNVKLFCKLQQAALDARIASPPKGATYVAATIDKYDSIEVPKGASVRDYAHDGDPLKPKRGRIVAWWMEETGDRTGEVRSVIFLPAAKAEPVKKPGKNAAADAPARQADDDDEPAPAREPSAGINKTGLSLIAARKTEALRGRLARTLTANEAIAALVLTLTAPNVSISGMMWSEHGRFLAGVRGRLVTPDGKMRLDDMGALIGIAADALSSVLSCAGPDSARGYHTRGDAGEVAEWIGHALSAEDELARFDTPEILSTCAGEVLRAAAIGSGLKPAKTVSALRLQLAGGAPDWRPLPAQFGAPGPVAETGDDGDDEEADVDLD
jgi:ParB family chromosome partitioning protein